MDKKKVFASLIFTLWFLASIQTPQNKINGDSSLAETLISLGDFSIKAYPPEYDSVLVKKGQELIKNGTTSDLDGRYLQPISEYFNCTNCHNLEREDSDLASPNPTDRLGYVWEKGIPFLQSATLFGVVNRESWYNGDYQIKYGHRIGAGDITLRDAIQICASECSSGRLLTEWELNAIIQYLWTIAYELGDLNLSRSEYGQLNNPQVSHSTKIDILKSKYAGNVTATFSQSMPIDERERGNPLGGERIFKSSCLSCHSPPTQVSHLFLSESNETLQPLYDNLESDKTFNIYKILRKGTKPSEQYGAYMPNFTKERLTDQQINDLRAYIEDVMNKD